MPTTNAVGPCLKPHDFWQDIAPSGSFDLNPVGGHRGFFPAQLPDGRQLALPIRVRDGGREALASLIINQASFAVLEALASALAETIADFDADIIVGLPTLGLTLAQETARKLGHSRYVALSFSRKFWYDDQLSVPVRSITSPDQQKWLFMDPRMLPLLAGKSFVLIDDVISSGGSILAAYALLGKCDLAPVAIGAAMLQTGRWRNALGQVEPTLSARVRSVFNTPRLVPTPEGGWQAS